MTNFEQHPQWQAVKKIHETLKSAGYTSLVAGGAVRDLFLGRMANDIDIATNAKPEQVEALFEKTVMVGREFGVARVILDGQDIEVATFRKDGPYRNGRRPEFVEFSGRDEDAKRRDFTINAMFYDLDKREVIDPVEGQKDLMRKVIRAVGDPFKRFDEDKLRMLRALRFHGELGFVMDPETAKAVKKSAVQIHQVSMERIRDEWGKLLNGAFAASAINKTYELGLWAEIFKDWKFQGEKYKKYFDQESSDTDSRWILWFLLHFKGKKEELAELGLKWKLSRNLIRKMIYCFQSMPKLRHINDVEPVDLAIFLGHPNGQLAMDIFEKLFNDSIKTPFFDKKKQAESFFEKGQLPKLLVNGDDLIQYGLAPGPKISKELKNLHRIQLLEGITVKEDLLAKRSR